MDIDIRDLRKSDEWLEAVLTGMIEDIEVNRKHGYYAVSIERLVLIELVAREIERKKAMKEIYTKGKEKDDA